MGVVKETLDLLGLAVLFDFLKDAIERIKRFFIPPRAFSWQTLIYLSIFSWLMSSLAYEGAIRDIIAFFGWVFLIGGTSWYTTDKPLYIPGTVMPVGAVITGGIVSIFAFQQNDQVISRTIVFWPTISALIAAVPEFFEGTGTDVNAQLPKLEDRESVIVLIGCCMLLSCWLNIYEVSDEWMKEYPSARYPIATKKDSQRNDLLTFLRPEDQIPQNGILILNKLQPAVETALRGKSWSNVELWLKNANERVNELGEAVIAIHLAEFEEKDLWKTQANVENIDPEDLNSGYRLDLFSVWDGPSAAPNGYYLQKSCQIEPIAEPVDTLNPQNEKITVAEVECSPKISYFTGKPPNQ
ncbi:septal junction protein FraD [Rivularia sp. UHCC 0363]|uniref:septal junction protein FraD n=1 Tax=Rivularia sp. UHCC 0363 TaxID=3110244 RepID=UPI002B215A75|nr:septal junction protein FraD [Rivularia sp. UHCC 0363]MEA5593153.1 septal junction protein FraD [Rivularia sp. UHCC 0363]